MKGKLLYSGIVVLILFLVVLSGCKQSEENTGLTDVEQVTFKQVLEAMNAHKWNYQKDISINYKSSNKQLSIDAIVWYQLKPDKTGTVKTQVDYIVPDHLGDSYQYTQYDHIDDQLHMLYREGINDDGKGGTWDINVRDSESYKVYDYTSLLESEYDFVLLKDETTTETLVYQFNTNDYNFFSEVATGFMNLIYALQTNQTGVNPNDFFYELVDCKLYVEPSEHLIKKIEVNLEPLVEQLVTDMSVSGESDLEVTSFIATTEFKDYSEVDFVVPLDYIYYHIYDPDTTTGASTSSEWDETTGSSYNDDSDTTSGASTEEDSESDESLGN